MVEEFRSEILGDNIHSPAELTQKFQDLMRKKGDEITNQSLYRVSNVYESVISDIERRIGEERAVASRHYPPHL